MTVSEVGCMGVKPGMDVMNSTKPESLILMAIWQAVVFKPGGPARVYWGLENEDESRLWAFFDWDSVEQHEHFAKTSVLLPTTPTVLPSPARKLTLYPSHGAEAVKDFPKICSHGEFTKHVHIQPSSDVLSSPLTEILLVYFPGGLGQVDRDEKSAELQHFLMKTLHEQPGVRGTACGWGLQNDFPVRGADGQTGSVLMSFIGWSTPDEKLAARDMRGYSEVMTHLQSMEGAMGFHRFTMKPRHLGRVEHEMV